MSFHGNAGIRNSPNQFWSPLAHDAIGTSLHRDVASSDRFVRSRNLCQPDAERHERMRCCFSHRDCVRRIRWIKLDLQRIDARLFGCHGLPRCEGHCLSENGFALQILKVFNRVVAGCVFSTQSHRAVESSLVRVSGRQRAKWVFVRFHGFRRHRNSVARLVSAMRFSNRLHNFNQDSPPAPTEQEPDCSLHIQNR